MIGLDTNVLLAWVLAGQARPLPPASSYRVTLVVLAELVWVLSHTLKYSRQALAAVLAELLKVSDIEIDRRTVVEAAAADFEMGPADFSDYLIARENQMAGCSTTLTLDRKAARHPAFTLLKD